MKFLCDEMVANLARWLRAAGYDTVLAHQRASDRALLEQACAEDRWLLTRDHKLLEFRAAPGRVLHLRGRGLEAWVEELGGRLPLNWEFAPFSRCLVCNSPLQKAADDQRSAVPASVRERALELWQCPGCRRLYWAGGHVRRMRARLHAFQGKAGV